MIQYRNKVKVTLFASDIILFEILQVVFFFFSGVVIKWAEVRAMKTTILRERHQRFSEKAGQGLLIKIK